MSAIGAFRPQGNSLLILTSSSTGAQAQQLSTGSATEVMLTNASTAAVVYVAFGSSSIAAVCPTTSAPGVGMALPFSFAKVFSYGPANNWISAVTSAGSATLYAQPGSGI